MTVSGLDLPYQIPSMRWFQYQICESEPDNMANSPSKEVKERLAADEPASLPAAVNPVEEPAQKPHPDGLTEATMLETQVVTPSSKPTPAQEPHHLFTPLAALWPTATPPEPPKTRQTAVKPTAPQKVKVSFVLLEPGAKQVFLCGEFNGWASDATPMKRDDAGHWETTIALAPGRHEYKFLVDGNWKHDPLARVNVWNQNGTLNSVAQVWA